MIVDTSPTRTSSIPHVASNRQFSLAQLLALVVAAGVMLAAGRLIAVFEQTSRAEWGIIVGAMAAVAVLLEVLRMHRATLLWGLAGGLFLIAGLVQLGLSTPRQAAQRSVCSGHLKQIAVALHTYHDEYGCFPPAVVRDANGRPMHSWRVLLLPYMEQQPLYARYRMDEPWNGPNNQKLHNEVANWYSCEAGHVRGSSPSADTDYVVVAGPRTAFPEDRCVRLSDITDDHGSTLLVVEIHNSGIHWMEPRDLHVTQMSRQINPRRGQGISSPHPGGANAVMVDGSLRFLTDETPPSTVERLLTVSGGDKVEWEH